MACTPWPKWINPALNWGTSDWRYATYWLVVACTPFDQDKDNGAWGGRSRPVREGWRCVDVALPRNL